MSTQTPITGLSDDRLATAMELLGGWVWETDEQHRFTFISDSLEKQIGMPPAYFYGKTRQEAGQSCDPSQLAAFERSLEEQVEFSSIDLTRVHSGEVIHMRITGKPVFDADGQFVGYRGVAHRVTSEILERDRRVKAERAHAESTNALAKVVENYPDPIVIFDREFRLTLANASYCAMVGMAPEDLPTGTSFESLVVALIDREELAGDDPEALVEHHVRMARSRETFCFERSRPDGAVLRVQQVPLPCGGFMRTFSDITESIEDKWVIYSLKNTVASLAKKRG